jgi:hypothetical protein
MKSQSKGAAALLTAAAPAVAASPAKKPAKKAPAKPAAVAGKLGKVVTLLKRSRGATLAELMKVTGWQAHSVRGAISDAVKKKLKLSVLSEKTGAVRTYRIKG